MESIQTWYFCTVADKDEGTLICPRVVKKSDESWKTNAVHSNLLGGRGHSGDSLGLGVQLEIDEYVLVLISNEVIILS